MQSGSCRVFYPCAFISGPGYRPIGTEWAQQSLLQNTRGSLALPGAIHYNSGLFKQPYEDSALG